MVVEQQRQVDQNDEKGEFHLIYEKFFGDTQGSHAMGSGKGERGGGGEQSSMQWLNKEYDRMQIQLKESVAACRDATASKEDVITKLAAAELKIGKLESALRESQRLLSVKDQALSAKNEELANVHALYQKTREVADALTLRSKETIDEIHTMEMKKALLAPRGQPVQSAAVMHGSRQCEHSPSSDDTRSTLTASDCNSERRNADVSASECESNGQGGDSNGVVRTTKSDEDSIVNSPTPTKQGDEAPSAASVPVLRNVIREVGPLYDAAAASIRADEDPVLRPVQVRVAPPETTALSPRGIPPLAAAQRPGALSPSIVLQRPLQRVSSMSPLRNDSRPTLPAMVHSSSQAPQVSGSIGRMQMAPSRRMASSGVSSATAPSFGFQGNVSPLRERPPMPTTASPLRERPTVNGAASPMAPMVNGAASPMVPFPLVHGAASPMAPMIVASGSPLRERPVANVAVSPVRERPGAWAASSAASPIRDRLSSTMAAIAMMSTQSWTDAHHVPPQLCASSQPRSWQTMSAPTLEREALYPPGVSQHGAASPCHSYMPAAVHGTDAGGVQQQQQQEVGERPGSFVGERPGSFLLPMHGPRGAPPAPVLR